MKQMSEGVVNYISPILEEGGALKDWVAWSDSFDKILDHPRFIAYTNNETDVSTVYDIIDMLFRIEINMNKSVGDSKAITDAKWNKCLEELNTIKDATWPDIDIDISIWEVIADIKAFPADESEKIYREICSEEHVQILFSILSFCR